MTSLLRKFPRNKMVLNYNVNEYCDIDMLICRILGYRFYEDILTDILKISVCRSRSLLLTIVSLYKCILML